MLKGFWKLTWVETKIFVREPMGFVGTLVHAGRVFVVLGRVLGSASHRSPPARLALPFNLAILAACSSRSAACSRSSRSSPSTGKAAS